MVESKWEFIAKRLERLGYTWLAAKAKEIETVLRCLYDNVNTQEWLEDYRLIVGCYEKLVEECDKLYYLAEIAGNPSYCIACVKSEQKRTHDKCSVCEFEKIAGKCCMRGSLFFRFQDTLLRVAEFSVNR